MSDADHGDEHRDVVRRGLRVVWTGIRAEPRVFALSVLGSALYGAGTAGAGWVLGLVTEAVLTPAFAAGRVGAGEIAKASGALLGVAVVTSVGVVVRRAAAGITMYRLQASYRRRITRQYLRLPLAWHHRHPAGQLLSNANADVEATWQRVRAAADVPRRPRDARRRDGGDAGRRSRARRRRDARLPAAHRRRTSVYQRSVSPLVTRAQALRGEVSSVAHESFDGALVVKTLGREDDETERFARAARSLRDANVAVGRTRGVFDPLIEALPMLGILAVLAIGGGPGRGG